MGQPHRNTLSGRLDKADDVAVCVLHGSDQLAPTDILDLLVRFRAGIEERLHASLDIVNVPVADRPCHPLALAVGNQTDILTFDVEADVVSLIHVGLYGQELAVQGLGLREVLDGLDDRLDAFGHGVPLMLLVTSSAHLGE
jgi:hypothetical protein